LEDELRMTGADNNRHKITKLPNMASVSIRKSSNGTFTRSFYGKYTDRSGKSRVKSLSTPMEGKPPANGSMKSKGDNKFEQSKAKALLEIGAFEKDINEHRSNIKDLYRLIEARQGAVRETKIADLPSIMENDRSFVVLSKPTQCNKRRVLKRLVKWCKKERLTLVSEISPSVAQQFVACLQQKDGNGKTFANGSVQTSLFSISSVFNLPGVMLSGAANPFHRLKYAKAPSDSTVSKEPLSDEEVAKLLGTAKDNQLAYDLIVAGLNTGQRKSDISKLKWEDVDTGDVEKMSLKIKQQKTGTPVNLPIVGELKDVVLRRFNERVPDAVYVFPEVASKEWAFKDLCSGVFKKAFAETKIQCGNRKHKNNVRGFHSLRATFITQRLRNGWTIEQVSAFSGHRSAEIIYKHYYKAQGVDFRDKLEADFAKRDGRVVKKPDFDKIAEMKKLLLTLSLEEKEALVGILHA